MKKYLIFIFSIILLCSITFTAFANEKFSDEKLQQIENMTKSLIEYRNTGNYNDFTKNFTDELKKHNTKYNVENLYGSLKTEIGSPLSFKVISKIKDNGLYRVTYAVNFEKHNRKKIPQKPIKVSIAVDDNNIVHDFFLDYLSTTEVNNVTNQIVKPFLESIYIENNYDKFISIVSDVNKSYFTQEKFNELKNVVESNAGKILGYSYVDSYTTEIPFKGEDIPVRITDLTYYFMFERKDLQFIVLPIEYENNDLKLGWIGKEDFPEIENLIKSSKDKKARAKTFIHKDSAPLIEIKL